MATSGLSKKEIIEKLGANDDSYQSLDTSHFVAGGTQLSSKDFIAMAEAMKDNTNVTEIKFEKAGLKNPDAIAFAEVIKSSTSITYIDMGYNNIGPDGMDALADALTSNSSVVECKLHRQESDMGGAVENKVADIYKTNTTLQRLYITLHDRRCNQANTRGEVRNKDIAKHIKEGKNWDHLDPAKAEEYAAKKKAEAEEKKKAEALANAPISEKVESTGGPYTLKQLTCKKEFRPDDTDPKNLEQSLADDEFEVLFAMDKTAFEALPKWKKQNLKKKHKLH